MKKELAALSALFTMSSLLVGKTVKLGSQLSLEHQQQAKIVNPFDPHLKFNPGAILGYTTDEKTTVYVRQLRREFDSALVTFVEVATDNGQRIWSGKRIPYVSILPDKVTKEYEKAAKALWKAVKNQNIKEMAEALANGANPNDSDLKTGDTPLHALAQQHKVNTEALYLLTDNGANPEVKNYAGKIPADIAHDPYIKNILNKTQEKLLQERKIVEAFAEDFARGAVKR